MDDIEVSWLDVVMSVSFMFLLSLHHLFFLSYLFQTVLLIPRMQRKRAPAQIIAILTTESFIHVHGCRT